MSYSYLPLALVVLWIVLTAMYLRRRSKPTALPLPPSLKPDFLIGHLRSVPSSNEHKVYQQWGKELGSDIISFNVLGRVIIVLNSLEAATELLVKRSSIYSDRPQLPMVANKNLMGWGGSTSFLPYNERWRSQRRMTHEVLHKEASKDFWPLVTKQSRLALQRILVGPNGYVKELRRMAGSTLLSSVYGYEVTSDEDGLVELTERAANRLGLAAVPGSFFVNVLPSLQHVPAWFPGTGWKRTAAAWRAEKDEMLDTPYNYTKEQMAAGTAPNSMLKRLLDKLANQEHISDLEEEEDRIKWTTGTMFAGGSDTSVSSALVFILAMTMHEDVQLKAQAEIDSFLGGTRLPEIEDQEFLPYMRNVLKEVLRWRSVLPLGILHASIQDDVYKGYHIPKGAIIMGNIWAISNNPEQYPNPEQFNPDRFSDPTVPDAPVFGFGRRVCPGSHLAEAILFVTITTLLAIFDIRPVYNKDGTPRLPKGEMTQGLFNHPAPFECVITPRSEKHSQLLREWSEM